jgi:hypothetical protein
MSEALARGATERVKHPGEERASLVAEVEHFYAAISVPVSTKSLAFCTWILGIA